LLHETAALPPGTRVQNALKDPSVLLADARASQDETARPVYPTAPYRAIRTRRWLYVRWRNGAEELYDRLRDPGQLNSLARQRASRPVILQLRRQLWQRVRCKGAACSAPAAPVAAPPGL
jgi:hypothetical protein